MSGKDVFKEEYKTLNPAQKEAVDTIDGPVMVVAGPGTGKTQILALRIGNILLKTDTKADSILCLTFTNSAVEAMKERLISYIGKTSEIVNIFTFHSFGMKIIEEHFKVLGLNNPPKLLEDTDITIFFDQILNENDWEYLRPRGDGARYFQDLRTLISLLKRERIGEDVFAKAIEKEIKFLKNSEDSISTRGESKGQLKKEVAKQIEGLEKTKEIVKFLNIYEKIKKEKNVLDYDDVLENLVKIVEKSRDALADIRERYLYVLVDEHQDSSRVQNEFLKIVWSEVEDPNVFVVGDDRQLIYGFSGASIDHFKGFQKTFSQARLLTLTDNYRSTQIILDASHALLQSVMSDAKLISQKSQGKESEPIYLVEAHTKEEEITAAGLDIKLKIENGKLKINDCAILVPKNAYVRDALEILSHLNLPIASLEALNLFDQEEARSFLRVLKIINNGEVPSLVLSFFDKVSGISPLEAHVFVVGENMREFSLDLILKKKPPALFTGNSVEKWLKKLSKWRRDAQERDLKTLLETIGKELFEDNGESKLVGGQEILNTFLNLLVRELEKKPKINEVNLSDFISYLEKLELYGDRIPLVVIPTKGVKVLTMHSSKGLEFDYVWIAHMDERSLAGGKKMGFTLPESIKEVIEERDIDAVKRKLYVAITRAKRFCTFSYSLESKKGADQELARTIADLPKEVFKKKKIKAVIKKETANKNFSKLQKLVREKYTDRYVSVSLLNNFFDCPWQWYFRNLLQLPEKKTESLEFGIAVHSAIDKILKFKGKNLKLILPEDKEVAKVVSNWAVRRLKDIAPNHENEQSVSLNDIRFPHFKIYGKIDLIENLGDKEVRVTDFKTGSVRKKSEIEKLDEEGRMSGNLRQLAMYSYLLSENTKWKVNVKESRLEFLEAKNIKEIFYDRIISTKEIELLIKDIKDYDNLVKSGEWVNRPCNYNSYGKNTECEYCKMAEIYK